MRLRAIHPVALGCLLGLSAGGALAAGGGRIAGVVTDSAGTPQLGAKVLISAEQNPTESVRPVAGTFQLANFQLLTNASGRFATTKLPSGSYSIEVSQPGYLPILRHHVRVEPKQPTLLDIVLGSAFSSFEELRRQPDQRSSPDDWTWTLRGSPSTRSVLRWQSGSAAGSSSADSAQQRESHGTIELTSGADRPGSIANLEDSPATAFGYDLGLGATSRLLLIGQVSYGSAVPAGAVAAEWLPSGKDASGPATSIVVRESRMGPEGPVFHVVRLAEEGQVALGDRATIHYGGEFIAAGFVGRTESLRPRAEVDVPLGNSWKALAVFAAEPAAPEGSEGLLGEGASESAQMDTMIGTMDDFPMVLLRSGKPVLADGMHEEFAIEHQLGRGQFVQAAVFHDGSVHTGVIGQGRVSGPDFVQDYFSNVFAYDGGASGSLGMRVAYRRGLGKNVNTTFVYDYAGALAPDGAASPTLRGDLATESRQSLAARVSARIPRLGTQIASGYKWLDGSAVSQQDPYGEALFHLDPYLSMQVRQPLPQVFPCRVELLADVGNLLAQGYVPLSTADGQLVLIPSYRFFKGGLSFQF